MEFKDRLKERRAAAGMSQSALATAIGVTLRTVQNYELGSRKPQHMEVVQKMADALGTTTEYLLGSEGVHVVNAYERGGASAARDVEALVGEIRGLFAGGELDEDEKDAIMAALNRAYWDAKEENKKYAPKKPRDNK
ncbi:MAG: helix-turn-helix transcriptional regulator [Clostridia bacterium]|nr:helix-turn-helix transcriptional regulator [Clostridia bacterium]